MSNHGYYLQLPGHLSRRGVIDVGLRCVHSCQFCFYRHPDDPKGAFDFMRHAEWRDTDQLVEQAKLMAGNGFLAADITGGEPSLHPGIVNLVRACSDASLAPRMISLAQFMDKRKNGETLLNHLLAAGMADFRISHHSHDPAIFKEITGGDLDKQLWAMRQLDEKGFEYTTNSTVVEGNYRTIPDLAREILTHNVYYSTLLFFMPHYDHALRVEERVRMRYSDAAKYVKEAADILEDGGVAVSVRYAPMCVMAGYEKNMVGMVGVRHDLHEWTNLVEHSGSGDAVRESRMIPMNPHEAPPGAWIIGETPQGPYLGRGSQQGVSKVFGKECQSCSALSVCDGVDKGYLDKHGETELTAYYFDQRGTVLDRDRLGYLAGHIAKLTPAGKPSVAVKRLLKPAPPAIETVSVVIANYNHGAEITKCIQSLSAQTWPGKLEIIVVDDGSTDGSHKLLSELAGVYENMTVDLYLEKSGGPARPRNIGLRKATGDLLAILDAGAYGYTMASEYNGRALPSEVFLEDGRVVLVRRRRDESAWIEERLRGAVPP